MRIGELSAATGVSRRLLRYYEQQGLLEPVRQANGYRDYPPSAVGAVDVVRGLLATGLSTAVIRELLPCTGEAGPRVEACAGLLTRIGQLREDMAARAVAAAAARDALDRYLHDAEATHAAYASAPANVGP